MWRYKGPVPSPQFRTSLKGFASFRASDRISLGLCCNCITVQLSCPLLHPKRVLLLKDSPINSLHTRDLWLRVDWASQTLLNKRVPLNLKENWDETEREIFIENHSLSIHCHSFVHDPPALLLHLRGTLLLTAIYVYGGRETIVSLAENWDGRMETWNNSAE